VTHDAPPSRFLNAGEFAAGRERRLGSAGVSAARGEQIGKVQAARLHLHQKLLRRGMRVGNLLQFENFGTAETGDDQRFHAAILPILRARRLCGEVVSLLTTKGTKERARRKPSRDSLLRVPSCPLWLK